MEVEPLTTAPTVDAEPKTSRQRSRAVDKRKHSGILISFMFICISGRILYIVDHVSHLPGYQAMLWQMINFLYRSKWRLFCRCIGGDGQ